MRDLFIDGEPSCRFCRTVSKAIRKRWIDTFRDYWNLDPWSGNATEVAQIHEDVARLAVYDTTPPNSRRASSTPSQRTLGESGYLPEGVSYYPPAGYGQASVGELSSREVSHHSGYDEAQPSYSQHSPIPLSGVVSDHHRTAAAEPTLLTFVEPRYDPWDTDPDVVVEEVIMEGEVEQDEGAGCWGDRVPSPTEPELPGKVTTIFKEVFQRAYSSGCYKAKVIEQPVIPMGSLSTGKRAAKSEFLPAYPPVEYWFKLAESMPNLKPHEKVEHLRGTIIPVEVEGLNHRQWKLPLAEKSLMPEGFCGVKHGNYTTLPQHAHATGDKALREAWLSNLRAANHLSCAGMINDYLKQMSDPTDTQLHGAALAASGIDLKSLQEGMKLPGVRGFLSEVAQACEAIGMLVLNATLSVGRGCAAATVGRSNLWIDAMGYDKKGEEMFADCPTSGNQGLCGCTPDHLERLKKEQTDREVVAKAMAGCRKPTASPSPSPGTGRG